MFLYTKVRQAGKPLGLSLTRRVIVYGVTGLELVGLLPVEAPVDMVSFHQVWQSAHYPSSNVAAVFIISPECGMPKVFEEWFFRRAMERGIDAVGVGATVKEIISFVRTELKIEPEVISVEAFHPPAKAPEKSRSVASPNLRKSAWEVFSEHFDAVGMLKQGQSLEGLDLIAADHGLIVDWREFIPELRRERAIEFAIEAIRNTDKDVAALDFAVKLSESLTQLGYLHIEPQHLLTLAGTVRSTWGATTAS